MAIISRVPLRAVVQTSRSSLLFSSKSSPSASYHLWHRPESKTQQCNSHNIARATISKHTQSQTSKRSLHTAQFKSIQLHNVSPLSRRNASTDTSAGPVEPKVAATAVPAGTADVLSWNEFLRLRKIRRRFNLAASTTLAAASFVGGLGWLSEQNLEQLGAHLFGLDPLFVMGLSALGFAGAGWILGPFIGSAVWRASYSSRVKGMAEKERDFFQRIRKYRVDPTQSSVQNPTPDYYGEKITSVHGYRQWLKDQRAFNRKRQVTI